MDPHSRAPKKNTSHENEVLPRDTTHLIQRPCYQRGSPCQDPACNHHHHHQSLKRKGRWGTTDDFAPGVLHFSLFSTALWDLPNSRPVHSLMSSNFTFCLPCLLPLSLCLARWYWPDLMNGRHVHTASVCVSLQWSGLCVV